MGQHADLSRIVAVDATKGHCPSITVDLTSASLPAPASRAASALITLTICEWRRVAEQIVEATHVLHA